MMAICHLSWSSWNLIWGSLRPLMPVCWSVSTQLWEMKRTNNTNGEATVEELWTGRGRWAQSMFILPSEKFLKNCQHSKPMIMATRAELLVHTNYSSYFVQEVWLGWWDSGNNRLPSYSCRFAWWVGRGNKIRGLWSKDPQQPHYLCAQVGCNGSPLASCIVHLRFQPQVQTGGSEHDADALSRHVLG